MKHCAPFVVGVGVGLLIAILAMRTTPQEAAAAPRPGEDPAAVRAVAPEDGKLRILCFGAHPDDCELQVGGTAALWARRGHHVKFVSVTNGDIGHWRDAGGPLARRRRAEVEKAADVLRISTEV